MNTDFTILGVKLTYDFGDADDVEKLENALAEAKEKLQELEQIQPPLTGAKAIRAMCEPYHNMFSKVFGEDKAEEIFRGKSNYGDCLTAIQDLISAENKGNNNLKSFAGRTTQPKMNRKQRRAMARQNANFTAIK